MGQFSVGVNTSVKSSTDDLHVPAFLRKQVDACQHIGDQDWSSDKHHHGLTPLGLSQFLQTTSEADWPTSYLHLQQIGLGAWVVEWLEFCFADSVASAVSEEMAVRAFLNVMAQQDTFDALMRSRRWVRNIKLAAVRLKGTVTGITNTPRSGVDLQLAARIKAALAGMTADEWPDRVYAMIEVDLESPDGNNGIAT